MKQPGAEGIAKAVRLGEMVALGKIKLPVLGLIRSCQKVFPFKLESLEDIKIIPVVRDESPNVIIKGETGEVVLTAERAFDILAVDADRKAIFLTIFE